MVIPGTTPESRAKPWLAYVTFTEAIPFGTTSIAWAGERFRAWHFRWHGNVGGKPYGFEEMLAPDRFEFSVFTGEEVGQRLAERWRMAIERLTGKKVAEIEVLPETTHDELATAGKCFYTLDPTFID